MMNVEVAEWFA